jgi:glyoxylase-like metal-dependent hydrolase (beta-lactamase superfamily II)
MKFSSIEGNRQKLDGGAMFGNAPKALWEKWIAPDPLNRIPLAARSLLVETENHRLLFEAGIGAYMDPKNRERFGIEEETHMLHEGLLELGLSETDITAIFISHLHFDHAGGLLTPFEEGREPELLFSKARFFVSKKAWDRSRTPHQRDRASFIPVLNQKLEESGRLVLLGGGETFSFDDLTVHPIMSDGHTPGMVCWDLRFHHRGLVFAADLVPGLPWIHLPITMGYDRFPERLIEEKKELLTHVAEENSWLFFTHDPQIAISKILYDQERKKFKKGAAKERLVRTDL